MRTAYKWSGWEPPKPIVFVLLWLCDIYLTISLDYPWFLYKRVISVTHLMDEHSELFCFITTAIWSVFVLSVWFKHSVLYSSEWRRSFVRIFKPTCDHSGSCWMFLLGREIPSSNLALSLARHSWIATFWRPTMQRMKSQVYIPCVEGLKSESASTELQVSRSLWDNENGDSFGGKTAYSWHVVII